MCPAQLQPFYFQCIPRNLFCLNSPVQKEGQFKFYLFKDNQKYDSSKAWLNANFQNQKMIIQNQKLQFFIHSFIEKHNVRFTLKLAYNNPTQKFIGSWDFFVNDYILQYKKNKTNRFLQNIQLSQHYSLDIQFFLETSKFHLQRAIKSYKNCIDNNFVSIKPNQTLKQSTVKEQEQVQIYSKQQQFAKLQQFKLQEEIFLKKKRQIQLKKAKLKSQQDQIQRKNIQIQKKSQREQKLSILSKSKWLIIALVMVLLCIFIFDSKYIHEDISQKITQNTGSFIPLKNKNSKKKQKKQRN